MRSMQWQLGILGTISEFAFRHRETKKNLCRDGRSQDLPNTDFQPAVRHLKYKQQCPHSTTNTHNITTHTRQLQQYTQDRCNNTHKTTTAIHTVNQQKLYKRKLKTSNKTHETNQNFTTSKCYQSIKHCVLGTELVPVVTPTVRSNGPIKYKHSLTHFNQNQSRKLRRGYLRVD